MSDRLREALDFYENRRPRALNNWEALDTLAAAARRFLALTETGPDYEAAEALFVEDLAWIVEACGENREGPNLAVDVLVRKIIRAGLADYLTEEGP